jgi:hypothetical protein
MFVAQNKKSREYPTKNSRFSKSSPKIKTKITKNK